MSTPHRPARTRPFSARGPQLPGRSTALAAVGCLLSFIAFCIAQRIADVSLIDLTVYRAEGAAVLDGADLYALRVTDAGLPTTYPPFAALLFTPLSLLGTAEMRVLTTLLNLGLLVVLVHLSLRLVGRPRRVPPAAAALAVSAAAVWCEPVWTTLRYGQINLLIAVLTLWDLSRRENHRWAGVGIGLAAGIKLTPALFAVHLLLCGLLRARRGPGGGNPQLRQAAVAAGTFLATAAVSAALLPRDSVRFWTDAVFRSERAGHAVITDNQSLRGVLARLLHSDEPSAVWLPLALVLAVGGLAIAAAAFLAGPRGLKHAPAWSAVACAVTALLVSPVSWSHHWVWCVPLAALLGTWAQEKISTARTVACTAAVVVFCSYALWWVPHDPDAARPPELGLTPVQTALSAAYPAVACAFLALTAVRAVRVLRGRSRRGTAGEEPVVPPLLQHRAEPSADQAVTKE